MEVLLEQPKAKARRNSSLNRRAFYDPSFPYVRPPRTRSGSSRKFLSWLSWAFLPWNKYEIFMRSSYEPKQSNQIYPNPFDSDVVGSGWERLVPKQYRLISCHVMRCHCTMGPTFRQSFQTNFWTDERWRGFTLARGDDFENASLLIRNVTNAIHMAICFWTTADSVQDLQGCQW